MVTQMYRYIVRQCKVSRDRLLIACLLPFMTAGVQLCFWDHLKPLVWFLLYPTVFFAPMIGGLCGGVCATTLSALLAWFIFISPLCPDQISHESAVVSMISFVVMGFVFSMYQVRYYNLTRTEAYSEAIQQSERFVRSITDNAPCLIEYWGKDLRCRFHNKLFCDWYGVSNDALEAKPMKEVLGAAAYDEAAPYIDACLSGECQSYERVVASEDGVSRYLQVMYTPDFDAGGVVKGFVVVCSDITAMRHAEAKLLEANQMLILQATTDPLTRIKNRRAFNEKLDEEWGRAIRTGVTVGLLMIDIDYFKQYNDHKGHVAGDHCLKDVADAIAGVVRHPPDMVARYGGEEFVCLLPGADKAAASEVATRVIDELRGRQLPHGFSVVDKDVTVSIGGASIIPDNTTAPEYLVKTADKNLYEAKNNGRNQVVIR